MPARPQSPAYIFLSCSAGGVPAGITEGVILSEFEKQIGAPLSKLVHGVYASSAATTITAPIFAKNKDNPAQPRATAQQALDTFIEDAPAWLDHSVNALQLLGIKLPFSKSSIHFDETKIEASLERRVGDMTLGDMAVSYFIPAHRLTAEKASDQAVLYHKIICSTGEEKYNPSADVKLKHLIRGTTAVPGFFKSAHINNDRVCDYGHLNDAAWALIRFQKSLPRDADVHFMEVGPPRYHSHISADILDRRGILAQCFELARGTGLHSLSSTLGLCKDQLGEDRVHNLSPDVNVGAMKGVKNAFQSMLDPSPAHISTLTEMAHEFIIGGDAFKRACDVLSENLDAWTKPAAGFNPAVLEKPKQKNLFRRLFGSHQTEVGAPAPAAA